MQTNFGFTRPIDNKKSRFAKNGDHGFLHSDKVKQQMSDYTFALLITILRLCSLVLMHKVVILGVLKLSHIIAPIGADAQTSII